MGMGDINIDIGTVTTTSTDYLQMLQSNAFFLLFLLFFLLLANQQE